MTVTYSLNVANTRLNGFAKLLIRWRGSIYKLLYREMIIFCVLYYSLSILYRYMLRDDQRRVFEKVVLYCEAFSKLIPLSFILGFYVSIVVTRWWSQYCAIPWPDNLLMMINGFVQGGDEDGRLIRRTLARYLLILQAVTFQAISVSVKRRFPTEDHFVEAGIMTKEEKFAYDEICGTHGKWWVPATWFTTLAIKARKEGRIKDDILLKHLLEELYKFRGCCGDLFAFDWISIPLVYTQAVTIAVYTYFSAVVMARQYLDPQLGYAGHEVDLYVPIFTLLEFFFFMGWLKVAEQLINPFGEDDDDFELNWILDRNLVVSIIIADQMYNKLPKLVRDNFWDDNNPSLPYTKSSACLRSQPYLGSAMNLDIHPEDTEFIPPSLETIMEVNENKHSGYPFSHEGDLVNLDFGDYDPAYLNDSRPQSSFSQSALNMLPDFLSSRIVNMIIGQSNENLQQARAKSREKLSSSNTGGQSLLSSFMLKSPRRRSRKVSAPNSLKPSISSSLMSKASNEGLPIKPLGSTTPPIANHKRPIVDNMDERRSLVINLNDKVNEPKLFSQTHHTEPIGRPRSRAISGSVDETALGFKYPTAPSPPTQATSDPVPNEDETTSLTPNGEYFLPLSEYSNSDMLRVPSSETFGSAYSSLEPGKFETGRSNDHGNEELTELKIQDRSNGESEDEGEANVKRRHRRSRRRSSSLDSFNHFESNQSTVTSITQLIGQSGKSNLTSVT